MRCRKLWFLLSLVLLLVSDRLWAKPPQSSPSCEPVGSQRALVVAVNYQDDLFDPNEDPLIEDIDARFFGAIDSLADFWDEGSYGKLSLTGDTYGWYTLSINSADVCDNFNQVQDMALQRVAQELADQKSKTKLTDYSRVFFVYKEPDCPMGIAASQATQCKLIPTSHGDMFASKSIVKSAYFSSKLYGNDWSIVKGVYYSAHEGGHSLANLGHTTTLDYGDVESMVPIGEFNIGEHIKSQYDPMSYNTCISHYTAPDKYELGWLGEEEVAKMSTSGSFTLAPITSSEPGIKALRIYRGIDLATQQKEYLWIETRQPVGWDLFLDSCFNEAGFTVGWGGALIHLQINHPSDSHGPVYNLDMSPGTYQGADDSFDSPLLENSDANPYTDPYGEITLFIQGPDAGGNLTVDVTFNNPDKVDSDEDGITDTNEGLYMTNPNNPNSDGDTFTDLAEVCFDNDCTSYNPFDPITNPDGTDTDANKADTDEDGTQDNLDNCPLVYNPAQDESVKETYYIDRDGDGYGNPLFSTTSCRQRPGWSSVGTDCEDRPEGADGILGTADDGANIYPGSFEDCSNGIDNDCDEIIDGGTVLYLDNDQDGYGWSDIYGNFCTMNGYWVIDKTDCDDNENAINPGATEICGNGVDEDCSDVPDDGCSACSDHTNEADCLADPRNCSWEGNGNNKSCVDADASCTITEDPEVSCSDGIDNDCDNATDCADSDCAAICGACNNDAFCDAVEDCQSCPADCDGVMNGNPDNRFCCGNGTQEGPEGDGTICDGNY